MKNTETISEFNHRLRMEALKSKDNSKQFRFISNTQNRMVINNPILLQKS